MALSLFRPWHKARSKTNITGLADSYFLRRLGSWRPSCLILELFAFNIDDEIKLHNSTRPLAHFRARACICFIFEWEFLLEFADVYLNVAKQ